MRKRLPMFVLLVALISAVGLAPALSGSHEHAGSESSTAPAAARQQVVSDPPGTIRGDQHPELIPDHFAYLAMFRMLSNRQTDEERNSIRAYVRDVIGLGKQRQCRNCRPSVGLNDSDIDALVGAANEFYQRVGALDQQAGDIKDRTWPNPGAYELAQLRNLQAQKEALVAEVAATLPRRLSAAGLQRFHQHIQGYVKQRIALTPAPATPPGGHGWQHDPDHN